MSSMFKVKWDNEAPQIIIWKLDEPAYCCVQTEFEMSLMGELKLFLGIQINQTPEETYIHQSKYVRELVKKFDLSECKPSNIPMHLTCILEREEVSKNVEQKVYRGMIGSLLSDSFKT